MRPVKVLTVDDEPLALRRLEIVLSQLPHVEHAGSAASCAAAVKMIEMRRPEVLLLDIKMRDGTGFDVLDRLSNEHMPAVVFVTAFDSYATQAFDTSAVDYVVKPVEVDRLARAIERARSSLEAREAGERIAELRGVVATLREEVRPDAGPRYETELWVRRTGSGFVRVPVDAIEYITTEDDYVRLHVGERSHLMRETLSGLQERLDPAQFLRVHRSALVRASAIGEFKRSALGLLEVHLTGGDRLRVGRVHAKMLRRALRAT